MLIFNGNKQNTDTEIIILHSIEDKSILISRVIDSQAIFEPAIGGLDINFDQEIAEIFEEYAI